MFIILLIVLVALIVESAYLYSLTSGLREAAVQLEDQIQWSSTTRLTVACPNRAAEQLLQQVNRLAERRQVEKTEWSRREQSLRQQIANVSHDLRTPLTSILGYLQLLEQEDLPYERRQAYLQVIAGRARTLQSFIGSFYDLTRIEGGEFPLERERISLTRILSDQLADSYEQLEQAGIKVEADLPSDIPAVWGDRYAATRVCSNLLTNALRHAKGSLTIRLAKDGNTVVMTFSNPAPDMLPEDAGRVFERFYSANRARDRESTGLGLAIVKALTERMGCITGARWDNGIFTLEIRWPL